MHSKNLEKNYFYKASSHWLAAWPHENNERHEAASGYIPLRILLPFPSMAIMHAGKIGK